MRCSSPSIRRLSAAGPRILTPSPATRGRKNPACGVANTDVHPKIRHPQRTREQYADWRSRCLRSAGFKQPTADRIARDPGFDLHALLVLVERGCSPELAVRIAAPQDWEEGAP